MNNNKLLTFRILNPTDTIANDLSKATFRASLMLRQLWNAQFPSNKQLARIIHGVPIGLKNPIEFGLITVVSVSQTVEGVALYYLVMCKHFSSFGHHGSHILVECSL